MDVIPPLHDSLILVVDDERINALLLVSLLHKGGFWNVISVADGEAALAFTERQTPACILLDVMMPGISGLDVCRRLRQDSRFDLTPIIIQTAMSSPEDRRSAFAAGASDVVAKPYDPAELEARVRVHLSNALLSSGLMAYRKSMEAEVDEACVLAETVFPQPEALADIAARGVRLNHCYHPCSALGGDYWSSWTLGPDQVALMVGDISGHGMSAALRMFALHTLVSPPPAFSTAPLALAGHLDKRLYSFGRKNGQYVAGVYGIFDTRHRTFRFVAAGMRDAFIVNRGSEAGDVVLKPFPLAGVPFGMLPDTAREVQEIRLEAGDTLIIYSDALVECDAEGDDGTGVPRDEADLQRWMTAAFQTDPPEEDVAAWLGSRFLREFGSRVNDDLLIVSASLDTGRSGSHVIIEQHTDQIA